MAAIQPQGGISFQDKFVKKGDGYETCIQVYDYPARVNDKWLKKLFTMRNVVSVMDISTMKRDETVAAINKSLLEQRMRMGNEKHLCGANGRATNS